MDQVAESVLDHAFRVHRRLGPGLKEKVYEALLEHYLLEAGHTVARQKRFSFEVDGVVFKEGLRPDLIVDGVLVVEVKSAKKLAAVDWKQVLTYLRVLDLQVGLLLNFGCATMDEGGDPPGRQQLQTLNPDLTRKVPRRARKAEFHANP